MAAQNEFLGCMVKVSAPLLLEVLVIRRVMRRDR